MPAPELVFGEEGHVSSAGFGDVYFARANGAEETKHVFLAGNRLPQRLAGRDRFTIGELGFGTGLNFLVAWQEFLRTTDGTQHLYYISVEKFPLTRELLATLHPELAAVYPHRLPGWHRVYLERCTLTLGFGEAETLLSGIDASVDAWFLDGFAPAKNPDMWSDLIFAQLARLSASDATCATFTAAGFVKRGLQAQGFTMQKIKGFAHKREMLVGSRAAVCPPALPSPQQTIVMGAGIAGCTVARALAERGVRVTVLEKQTVAAGASGNPAAVLYPQLTKYYTPATAWHLTGYGFMLRQLARWKAMGLTFRWQQAGMVRIPRDGNAKAQLESLQIDPAIAQYVSREEAAAHAGTEVAGDGVWLPEGSWIAPSELCHALLQHPNITLHEATVVTRLERVEDGWKLQTTSKDFSTTCLVVCVAEQAGILLPEIIMPIGKSAGQVSVVESSSALQAIVSHRGYVIPMDTKYILGATYDRTDFSGAVTEANHAKNLQHAHGALPQWKGSAVLGGRTSIRATTPDKLPYVGMVDEGLYVSIGHGSRGMISAPLAAEVLASQIVGEMVPLTPELRAAINPLRRSPLSS